MLVVVYSFGFLAYYVICDLVTFAPSKESFSIIIMQLSLFHSVMTLYMRKTGRHAESEQYNKELKKTCACLSQSVLVSPDIMQPL